jgi:hypothetical protein
MDNTSTVNVLYGTHQVKHEMFGFVFVQSLLLGNVVIQRLSITKLHYDIDVAIVVAALIELDYVWVIKT